MNINDELSKLNNNQRQELEKWFAEQIYKLNKVNKYYNNYNRETGEYSNPEVPTKQMNLIDKAIQELKFKSK